ncbi:MAG: hypothetical protein AB7H90_06365 [Alphaproteobacteria bacterium]
MLDVTPAKPLMALLLLAKPPQEVLAAKFAQFSPAVPWPDHQL